MNPVSRSVRNAPLIVTRFNHINSSRSSVVNRTRTLASNTSSTSSKTQPPSEESTPSNKQETTDSPNRSSTPPPPPPTENISSTSKRVWKAIYYATGAAAVGATVAAAAHPEIVRQRVSNVKNDIEAGIRLYTEPSSEKLLPDPHIPYPGAKPLRTLVIELDKTLVHSSYSRATGWRVAKRPGAEAFLAYMASFYEVVIFTSSLYSYADPILNKLDPNGYISHRLYRAETHYKSGVHIKDLSHLNRPLERVVVLDINEKNVSMHPENAIIIPEWKDDSSDTTLLDLIPLLENLVKADVADVRDEIGVMKGQSIAEGVAEYRAVAAKKASQQKSVSLFGNMPTDPATGTSDRTAQSSGPNDDADGDKNDTTGSVWGSLSSTSKLFHSKQ